MMKTDIIPPNQPICKKIQNYIFKFTDLLGKGNFSKVYKAHHEITSTSSYTQALLLLLKSYSLTHLNPKNYKSSFSLKSTFSKNLITQIFFNAIKFLLLIETATSSLNCVMVEIWKQSLGENIIFLNKMPNQLLKTFFQVFCIFHKKMLFTEI